VELFFKSAKDSGNAGTTEAKHGRFSQAVRDRRQQFPDGSGHEATCREQAGHADQMYLPP